MRRWVGYLVVDGAEPALKRLEKGDRENEHMVTLLSPVSVKLDDGPNEFVALAERLENRM